MNTTVVLDIVERPMCCCFGKESVTANNCFMFYHNEQTC